jgi:hypothetical protein
MPAPLLHYAPKVPVGWIEQLYRCDALGVRDEELLEKVGQRLLARCLDVVRVSDSLCTCPACSCDFEVPWIGTPPSSVSLCPRCGWQITAGEFHVSFEHQDLLGTNARAAFSAFIEEYRAARGYPGRMLTIDRVVHAVHVSGNLAARNLLEGRPREVLARLDALHEANRSRG